MKPDHQRITKCQKSIRCQKDESFSFSYKYSFFFFFHQNIPRTKCPNRNDVVFVAVSKLQQGSSAVGVRIYNGCHRAHPSKDRLCEGKGGKSECRFHLCVRRGPEGQGMVQPLSSLRTTGTNLVLILQQQPQKQERNAEGASLPVWLSIYQA